MKMPVLRFAALVFLSFAALLARGCADKSPDPAKKDDPHAARKHEAAAGTAAKEPARPAASDLKPQETCPVMGGRIDRSLFVDHEGKRIYFCCSACIDEFKASPDKYLRKLAETGQKPEETPK